MFINSFRNDLAVNFQNDLEQCDLTLSMSDISKKKNVVFRKLVKTKARNYLMNLIIISIQNWSNCSQEETKFHLELCKELTKDIDMSKVECENLCK